jgi:hypothetical protein
MELTKWVDTFIERGDPRGLPELLTRCLAEPGLVGLAAMQRLSEDMYGRITFNTELKAPAAYCLVAWGVAGLDAIVEAAKRTPELKNIWTKTNGTALNSFFIRRGAEIIQSCPVCFVPSYTWNLTHKELRLS